MNESPILDTKTVNMKNEVLMKGETSVNTNTNV
jgi:hypothetical protein